MVGVRVRATRRGPFRAARLRGRLFVLGCGSAIRWLAEEHRLPDTSPEPTFTLGLDKLTPPPASSREGNVASPAWKCRRYSLVCSYVTIPPGPDSRSGSAAAGSLRACPVRLEPCSGTARALASGPHGRPVRGIPGRRPEARRGTPRVPPRRGGACPKGRLGPVPLVPCRACGREVVPGDDGPRG